MDIEAIKERLDDHDEQIKAVREQNEKNASQLMANSKMIQETRDNTKEIIEFFRISKGFIFVMNWFGILVKWVVVTAAAIGTLWALVSTEIQHWHK